MDVVLTLGAPDPDVILPLLVPVNLEVAFEDTDTPEETDGALVVVLLRPLVRASVVFT